MTITNAQRLAGKTAVITGGTTGIGLATARRFHAEGAKLLITGRDQARIDEAISQIGGGTGVVGDSTDLSDLDRVASTARERFEGIDILFVNAGNGMFAPVSDVDEALYDRQFDLNVKGVFFTVQKMLPLMRRGGSIILTASAVHGKGAPGGSIYFASKAAVRSFARTMAAELSVTGIRVNALSPGIVPTQFFVNSNAPDELYNDFEQMAGKNAPLGRAGTPDEIANAAVFLASDDASFVTAADFVVDGGWMNV